MAINMCAGNISPPMGLNLYIVKGLMPNEINLGGLFKAAVPFMVLDLVTIALVMIFPGIVTWLPALMV